MKLIEKAHHILRRIVVKEVSSVDRGAGEGVRVMLSKRATPPAVIEYMKRTNAQGQFPIESAADLALALQAYATMAKAARAPIKKHIIERAAVIKAELPELWRIDPAAFSKAIAPAIAKAMPDLPAEASAELLAYLAKDVGAGDPDDGAVLFDEALKAKEVTQEFCQEFYEATDTLRESIASILCDDAADKPKLIDETLAQFTDHLRGILPEEMEKALAAGFAVDAGGARSDGVQGMNELLKKLGLPATATESDIIKALDEKAKKENDEADKKVEKLAPAEIVYMAKMDPAGHEAFQKMSPADRAKKMKDEPANDADADDKIKKALASGDAFKDEGGTILTKRDFPTENGFNYAKNAAAREATLRADLAKRDEASDVVAFGKRAVGLGFQEAFGETLRKAYKGDTVAIEKLESEIKGLREQARVGKLFDESGSSQGVGGKGYDQLMAKAAELVKVEKGLTIEQAFAKVYESPATYGMGEAVELYKRDKAAAQ